MRSALLFLLVFPTVMASVLPHSTPDKVETASLDIDPDSKSSFLVTMTSGYRQGSTLQIETEGAKVTSVSDSQISIRITGYIENVSNTDILLKNNFDERSSGSGQGYGIGYRKIKLTFPNGSNGNFVLGGGMTERKINYILLEKAPKAGTFDRDGFRSFDRSFTIALNTNFEENNNALKAVKLSGEIVVHIKAFIVGETQAREAEVVFPFEIPLERNHKAPAN